MQDFQKKLAGLDSHWHELDWSMWLEQQWKTGSAQSLLLAENHQRANVHLSEMEPSHLLMPMKASSTLRLRR